MRATSVQLWMKYRGGRGGGEDVVVTSDSSFGYGAAFMTQEERLEDFHMSKVDVYYSGPFDRIYRDGIAGMDILDEFSGLDLEC